MKFDLDVTSEESTDEGLSKGTAIIDGVLAAIGSSQPQYLPRESFSHYRPAC